jgi:hypothetical protein
MEDVIVFLLFAYLFVIRPILKRLRATRDGSGSSPKPSLRHWLETLRQKLREAAEQASTRPSKRQSDEDQAAGEEIFPAGEAPRPTGSPLKRTRFQESWQAKTRYLDGEPAPEWGSLEGPVSPDQPPDPPQVAGGVKPETPVAAKAALGRVNLKWAVVWSEILGPPVSLRDH